MWIFISMVTCNRASTCALWMKKGVVWRRANKWWVDLKTKSKTKLLPVISELWLVYMLRFQTADTIDPVTKWWKVPLQHGVYQLSWLGVGDATSTAFQVQEQGLPERHSVQESLMWLMEIHCLKLPCFEMAANSLVSSVMFDFQTKNCTRMTTKIMYENTSCSWGRCEVGKQSGGLVTGVLLARN